MFRYSTLITIRCEVNQVPLDKLRTEVESSCIEDICLILRPMITSTKNENLLLVYNCDERVA